METNSYQENVISYEAFSLKHPGLMARFLYPFIIFKKLKSVVDEKNKKALNASLILPGLGRSFFGLFEDLVLGIILLGAYLSYFIASGYKHLFGIETLTFFPLWVIPVFLFLLYLLFHYQSFKKTVFDVYALNRGKKLEPSPLVTRFKKIERQVTHANKVIDYTYRRGNRSTRFNLISGYLVPFLPFLLRNQLVKGFSILVSFGAYFTYMGMQGFASLDHMINLSTYVGDRRQPLVYGIIAIIFTLYILFVYVTSQVANVNAENALLNGRKIVTIKQEVEDLKNKTAYKIMIFIPIIGAVLFTVIPLAFMISLAFTNFNLARQVGINRFIWTKLDSFRSLFDGGTNFQAFVNVFNWTMVWSFFATLTTYFGGFFLALLIAKKTVKWKKLYRSLFVVAMAVPQFVSLRVMYAIFHDFGPINTLIMNMGGEAIMFWSDVNTAKTLIILINMWVGIPYFMLLISGLLLNIPKDYYEAAEIDGASKWHIFKKITFPYIIFATTPLLITKFVDNINNFNVIWLLTRGGPLGQGTGGVAGGTDIFITWLYKLTMYNLNVAEYDIGAAIGIIMFIISSVLSLLIFRKTGAYKKESEFRK